MRNMTIVKTARTANLRLLILALAAASLASSNLAAAQQTAPLAPKWLAGTPTPPVETFADGLQRHHIDTSEPSLIAALQNSDGEVRSLAAAQLAASDDHPALTQILSVMEYEPDPQVKVNLAGAASWLGSSRALDQLQHICQNLNVPSVTRLDAARYVSHKELAGCFSPVKDIARHDQDPAVRAQALLTAANYRGQTSSAGPLAMSSLADRDPTVRITAIDLLKQLNVTEAIGPLRDTLLSENDDTVREHLREAIRALNLANQQK